MYVIIISRKSFIMDLIGQELSELSALELENLPYLTLFTLASANIHRSIPNLATIFMPIRSRMSLIIGQSAPNYVKMYVIIRSHKSLIMDIIRLELSELAALELENLPYLTLFTL